MVRVFVFSGRPHMRLPCSWRQPAGGAPVHTGRGLLEFLKKFRAAGDSGPATHALQPRLPQLASLKLCSHVEVANGLKKALCTLRLRGTSCFMSAFTLLRVSRRAFEVQHMI